MGFVGFIAEVLVLASIAGAIAANVYVVTTCDMLELSGNLGKIGPWRAEIRGTTDGCEGWDKADSDDWRINMARATSMMGLCFGCVLLFVGFFKQCIVPLPCSQILMDISGMGSSVSLALVWPIARSDVCSLIGCRWGSGATALLVSMCLYVAASLFARCMREPRYIRRQNEAEEESRQQPQQQNEFEMGEKQQDQNDKADDPSNWASA